MSTPATFLARLRRPWLVTQYEHGLRLFPTRASRLALAVLLAVYALTPLSVSDFVLSVLIFAGIFAIGALGLNLLTGYTGQVSVGHAFFMATGAYAASHFGAEMGLPIFVWLPLAAVVGGIIGGAIGPFALRLRGNYLAIVSVGLVFIGLHIWNNFESVTGGAAGTGGKIPAAIGPLDFNDLSLGGQAYTKAQSWFWLTWALVGLVALGCGNIVRTRPGRAMQAVRDRDAAAAVIGVHLARYKVGAFVISSALGAVAGALYFGFVEYVSPEEWGLQRSIQFIAIVIVGGAGTIYGTIYGALFLGSLPRIVEEVSSSIPLVTDFGLSVEELNLMIFGLLLVSFLIFEPHGLAAVWGRTKAYFKAWPFSY